LAALDGLRSVEVAEALAIHENTAGKWRKRWAENEEHLLKLVARLEQDDTPCTLPKLAQAVAQEILNDAPRSGAPPKVHGGADLRNRRDGLP